MITTTQLDRLTEGWPDDPDNFELQSFAGRFRDDRPELSAPALDRISNQLQAELNRQSTPPAPLRLAGAARGAAQRFGTLDWSAPLRRIVPLATAALVLLATALWLGVRPSHPTAGDAPQLHPTPVQQRPPRPNPLTPNPAPRPDLATP